MQAGKMTGIPTFIPSHRGSRNLLSIFCRLPTPKLSCSTVVFSTAPFFWVHLCKWICNLLLSYQDVCWRRDIFVLENWQLGQGHPKKGNSALEYLRQNSGAHQVRRLTSCSSWRHQKCFTQGGILSFYPGKKKLPLILSNYFCLVSSCHTTRLLILTSVSTLHPSGLNQWESEWSNHKSQDLFLVLHERADENPFIMLRFYIWQALTQLFLVVKNGQLYFLRTEISSLQTKISF